jgi:hypothetical protein
MYFKKSLFSERSMKTSILCEIAVGLLVSNIQQANGIGGMMRCGENMLCGEECTMAGNVCTCSGECTENERRRMMAQGVPESDARKTLKTTTGKSTTMKMKCGENLLCVEECHRVGDVCTCKGPCTENEVKFLMGLGIPEAKARDSLFA